MLYVHLGPGPLGNFGTMDADQLAGLAFVALAGVMTVFQIALALGAPWGAAAYGGTIPGTLPTRQRVTSGLAGFVLYPMVAVFVADTSGLVELGWTDGLSSLWLWVLAGLFAVGTLANAVSRSTAERYWAIVTLGMCLSSAWLAIGM
jgi:hypothetical protein